MKRNLLVVIACQQDYSFCNKKWNSSEGLEAQINILYRIFARCELIVNLWLISQGTLASAAAESLGGPSQAERPK